MKFILSCFLNNNNNLIAEVANTWPLEPKDNTTREATTTIKSKNNNMKIKLQIKDENQILYTVNLSSVHANYI